jgi:hypothetical protein
MSRRTTFPTLATAILSAAFTLSSHCAAPATAPLEPNKDATLPPPAAADRPPTTMPAASEPSTAATQASAKVMPAPTNPGGPAAAPAATLPVEFAILQTRSPFARGKPKANPGAPSPQDAALVLKGITDTEAKFTAYIEDKNAKRVVQLAAGQPLGRGKIKSIDLDAIEYEAGGATKRIEVGQNLNGEVVPPTPTSKPAPPPGQPQPGQGGPGQPQPGQPIPPGAMPPGAPGPRAPKGAPTPPPQAVPEG